MTDFDERVSFTKRFHHALFRDSRRANPCRYRRPSRNASDRSHPDARRCPRTTRCAKCAKPTRNAFRPAARAGEEIVFIDDRNEIEREMLRRRLHAEAEIRHAARDERCDGRMREFGGCITVDLIRIDADAAQRQVEQHARARARLTVHEAHIAARQIAQTGDLLRIALRQKEALRASRETNELMLFRTRYGR